jgi:signal transduction histidine kinase
VLSDASRDPRYAGNPFTTGELGSVRFYGSHPLVAPSGIVFGTLCVFDAVPHEVDPGLEHFLASLAARVVDVLELEVASRQLAVADERLAGFAGQVSHDLKNPLSAIRMSLELAREELGEDADDTVSSLLERSLRGTTRMEAMIDDLLAFARVGTSHQLGRVDLAAVLADVLEDLGDVVSPGRVRHQDLPTVQGDAVQLRVVLQNLVANAVKFAPWDTEVEVSAERVPAGWRVSVADRGPGVPPEHRERVFEPMVRLDKSVPGSGIGLATCRRIVEGHGGRMGLDGRVGGGAVTWFELPD